MTSELPWENDTTRWDVDIYTNGEFDIHVALTADDITELVHIAEQMQKDEEKGVNHA